MSPAIAAKVEFIRMVEASLIAKPAAKNHAAIMQALRVKKAALYSDTRIEGVIRIVVGF